MSDLSVLSQFEGDVAEPLLQQGWQNYLLGEMGITRWVSQTDFCITLPSSLFVQNSLIAPISLDSATVLHSPTDSHQVSLSQNSVAVLQNPSSVIHEHDNDRLDDSTVVPTNYLEPVYLDTARDLDGRITPEAHPTDANDISRLPAPTLLLKRMYLQAIVINGWLLLADSQVLESNPRQYALWQQLVNGFGLTIHHHAFPLLESVENLPLLSQHHMTNVTIAKIAFEGFAHAVTHGNHTQLGRLTTLPQHFEALQVQALPLLSELLNDPQQKRHLWQRLKTPAPARI